MTESASPEYLYSIPQRRVVLLGEIALEELVELQPYVQVLLDKNKIIQQPETKVPDGVELGALLANPSGFPLAYETGYVAGEFSDLGLDEYKMYGKWLLSLLPPPKRKRASILNRQILTAANHLGVGPSSKEIVSPSRFGKLANFYQAIEAPNVHVRFGDLSQEEAIEYVLGIGRQLGHIPSEEELAALARQNSRNYSYEVLSRRVPGILTLAALEAGYVPTRTSYVGDRIQWGVEYMVANGMEPTEDQMLMHSSVGKGLGANNIRLNFGKLSVYKEALRQKYQAGLDSIKSELAKGSLPSYLNADNASEATLLARYARYRIVHGLQLILNEDQIEGIVLESQDEDAFLEKLHEYDPSVELKSVREAAQDLGIFQNLWRTNYIRSLSLDSVIHERLDRKRGTLRRSEIEKMNYAVKVAADFIRLNGVRQFKEKYIVDLQSKNLLPEQAEFDRFFENSRIFRMLVRVQLAKEDRTPADQASPEKWRTAADYLENLRIQPKERGRGSRQPEQLDNGLLSYDEKKSGLLLIKRSVLEGAPKPYKTDERLFIEWDRERCLEYGRFLVKLVEPEILNSTMLANAARLGIGPGLTALQRRFGSLSNFYSLLGLPKRNSPGAFSEWGDQQWLDYLGEVAAQNDGQLSERIIKEHYSSETSKGHHVPSLSLVKKNIRLSEAKKLVS